MWEYQHLVTVDWILGILERFSWKEGISKRGHQTLCTSLTTFYFRYKVVLHPKCLLAAGKVQQDVRYLPCRTP